MAFENLDKALARQNQKLSQSILQPTIVSTLDDLKRVLAEIDPKNSKPAQAVELVSMLSAIEDGKNNTYKVTATTRSKSKREMLLEGMELIKRQIEVSDHIAEKLEPIEVNGVLMKPPKFGKGGSGEVWVDPLIKHWLGGYRDGLTVCWDLDGHRYRYDIYQHKLSREKNEK